MLNATNWFVSEAREPWWGGRKTQCSAPHSSAETASPKCQKGLQTEGMMMIRHQFRFSIPMVILMSLANEVMNAFFGGRLAPKS